MQTRLSCRSALIIVTALALLPLHAASQTIRGVVLDEAGRPLAQVQVVALPAGAESLSGSDGRFLLRALPHGEYRVRVSLIGYAPAERVGRGGGSVLAPLE